MIERFKRLCGVDVLQGWGMTETGPVASLSRLTPEMEQLPEAERFRDRARQGRVVPGIRFRVVDSRTASVPWDNKSMGELQVRGNWVARDVLRGPDGRREFDDGWLRTGDVAVVDEFGSLQLVDRTKDLVKSGGEWISHRRARERADGPPGRAGGGRDRRARRAVVRAPAACVVAEAGRAGDEGGPDRVPRAAASRSGGCPTTSCSSTEVPKTSVGKFDKKVLREDFKEHELNAAGRGRASAAPS